MASRKSFLGIWEINMTLSGYYCKCKYCGRQEMHFGNCEGCGAFIDIDLSSNTSIRNYNPIIIEFMNTYPKLKGLKSN